MHLLAALLLSSFCIARAAPAPASGPIVDLGYARYQGIANAAPGLNAWLGIKFAAPPTGNLRWRAPQPPLVVPGVQSAQVHAVQCIQGDPGGSNVAIVESMNGTEDCLTLDLFAPVKATPLSNFKVAVYIHGGGYTAGDAAQQEPPAFLTLANSDVVYVTVNYRLGLFGFLAGTNVAENGVLNAGLLDQQFALQWVQQHIRTFGGNPNDVTIWGESAGGGSMLQLIVANGGRTNPPLFQRAIASSPFLPFQYNFNAPIPEMLFKNVTDMVGCTGNRDVMACLRAASVTSLKDANAVVESAGQIGNFVWVPVVDGKYIQERPSAALLQGKTNGQSLIVTTNQHDGVLFADPSVGPTNFSQYVQRFVPTAPPALVQEIVNLYPASEFATPLLRTAAVYQEPIFFCPAYWMADSFANHAKVSFRGFWDIGAALHAADLAYDFAANITALQSFTNFQNWVGMSTSFIRFGNPNTENLNPATNPPFPQWNSFIQLEKHFNITAAAISDPNIQKADPRVIARCNFWQSVGAITGQ